MNLTEFSALFESAIAKNRLSPLQKEQIEQFYHFTKFFLKTNETTNLTAIRNLPDVINKHYIDSLTASPLIPHGARVLDLGCGPGFPSIPLAIHRPDLSIVALDSTAKKIDFLNKSTELLGLSNLKGVSGRAEAPIIRKELGLFDVVVSRAVARLNVLNELCIPYLTIGGMMIAMKGAKADEELAEAQKGIQILGGKFKAIHATELVTETGNEARGLVMIQKETSTPNIYPRQYASIVKKPL